MKSATRATMMSAGWFSGRTVDTGPWDRALRADGYGVPGTVRDFLREFGGLTVHFRNPRAPNTQTDFVVDPVAGVRDVYTERVCAWADRIGADLTVIGQVDRGSLTMTMDEAGRVFAGSDDYLVFLGSTGADALDALLRDEPFRPVP